jgi:MFS family permease
VLRETNPVVLLEKKASKLRRQTGDARYRSKLAPDIKPSQLFRQSILRPTKMLLCCPVVTIMCTYGAILYGTLYLLFTTYSFVFKDVYNFSTFAAGLVFLPGGAGTLAGLLYIGMFSDRNLKRQAAAGKPVSPEARLPLIIILPGALTFPIGLFIYGWSTEAGIHWAVPLLGTAITGFGSIVIFIAIQTYLIDTYEQYAASVIGANAVLRGMAGAFIPLGALDMYNALGWGWGNSVLGFVTLALAPVLWIFASYGHRLRSHRINQVDW